MRKFRDFDLLPEYFRAIAGQFQRILWGPALIAVVFVIASLLGALPKWIAIIYLVAVMFVAGYYVWRADHLRLMPKVAATRIHIQPTPCILGRGVYVQIEPECLTESPLEECQGYLIRVLHKWPVGSGIGNGEWEPTEVNEPQPLGWSLGNPAPRTLIPGIPQRLNVFWIYSEEPRFIQPCVEPMPLRSHDVLTQQGSFRFEVKIRAKNCPAVDVAIEVERGDPWDKPKVTLIQNTKKGRVAHPFISRSHSIVGTTNAGTIPAHKPVFPPSATVQPHSPARQGYLR